MDIEQIGVGMSERDIKSEWSRVLRDLASTHGFLAFAARWRTDGNTPTLVVSVGDLGHQLKVALESGRTKGNPITLQGGVPVASIAHPQGLGELHAVGRDEAALWPLLEEAFRNVHTLLALTGMALSLNERNRDLASIIDAYGIPSFVVDRNARIYLSNSIGPVADVKRDCGFTIHDRVLQFTDLKSRRMFAKALQSYFTGSARRARRVPMSGLAVELVPLGNRNRALVTIRALGSMAVLTAEDIARVFGLSRKQALLCEALLRGQNVKGYAESCGVAVATVRWHMKRVFHQLGCRSQVELVRIIALQGAPG